MSVAKLIAMGLPNLLGRSSDFNAKVVTQTNDSTSWGVPGVTATTREQMGNIDWTQEVHGKDHPIAMACDSEHIYDARTGEIIADIRPGYRFWYNHSHMHVAPDNWDGKMPCRVYNEPVSLTANIGSG